MSEQETEAAFFELASAEPRLLAIKQEIEAIAERTKGSRDFCALPYWYGGSGCGGSIKEYDGRNCLKEKMSRLVGWGRGEEDKAEEISGELPWRTAAEIMSTAPSPNADLLAESLPYDVAYDYLYHLLPDCRGFPGCGATA